MSLTSTQVRVLHALSKSKSASREALEKAVKAKLAANVLGPLHKEDQTNHKDSLVSQGFVTVAKGGPNDNGVLFSVTAKGLKVAGEQKALPATDKSQKVPNKELDKAVVKIRSARTYGLDLLTEEDVRELRSLLGPKYKATSLDFLRKQVVNRRKQGAYTIRDPAKAKVKAAARLLREYGPEGTVCKGFLTAEQVKVLSPKK